MCKDFDREARTVAALSTEDLRSDFAQGLSVVRGRLLRMAAVLAELDKRGAVVKAPSYLRNLLRRIAAGELLVDVIVRFAGTPKRLMVIAAQSLERQQELLGKTDAEIAVLFKARRKGSRKKDDDERGSELETTLSAWKLASPRDAAEMIYQVIVESRQPRALAGHLLALLQAKKFFNETRERLAV